MISLICLSIIVPMAVLDKTAEERRSSVCIGGIVCTITLALDLFILSGV